MNQLLIERLAEQANFKKDKFVVGYWDMPECQKFVELIVWEAIGVCRVDVDALTAPFLSEYEKGVVEGYRRANENLRVYFGVEE